jgi:hypothetical protein
MWLLYDFSGSPIQFNVVVVAFVNTPIVQCDEKIFKLNYAFVRNLINFSSLK